MSCSPNLPPKRRDYSVVSQTDLLFGILLKSTLPSKVCVNISEAQPSVTNSGAESHV